jgi:GABA(A) receptor-associated protein
METNTSTNSNNNSKSQKKIETFYYKLNNSFEERLNESTNILKKYPTRIPVIAEIYPFVDSSPEKRKKYKYLVPDTLTLGQLGAVFRKEMRITPTDALFVLTDTSTMPSITSSIKSLYDTYKDPDGFIYLIYKKEEIYGGLQDRRTRPSNLL